MRRQLRTQMDLFTPADQTTELPNVDRRKAIALLQTLLKEAAAAPFANHPNKDNEEAGHE
jgi:hypothetical protein